MSVRLSKALKDLNVGLSTAVDFLVKKGHKIEPNPNEKIADDLYLLLAKEFNKDMALKIESEKLSQERHNKDKTTSVAIEGYEKKSEKTHIGLPKEPMLNIKQVGHIDLDAKNKPVQAAEKTVVATPKLVQAEVANDAVVEKKVEVVAETVTAPAPTPAPEAQPKPVVEVATPKVEAKVEIPVQKTSVENISKPTVNIETQPKTVVETVKENPIVAEQRPIVEEKKVEEKKIEKVEIEKPTPVIAENTTKAEVSTSSNEESNDSKEEIFSLGVPVLDKGPVVVGTIDLNLLNQSTRPKPKSKEQKRREREEKNRPSGNAGNTGNKKQLLLDKNPTPNSDADHKKKPRERFSNQKVDINKVQQGGGNNRNNNNNNNNNNAGAGKSTPSNIAAPKKVGHPQHSANNQGAGKANNKAKKPFKQEVNEEEVQRHIKETLARMAGGQKKGKGAKHRRDKRDLVSARQQEQAQRERDEESILKLTEFVTVSELATMMDVSINQVIGTCMSIGMMVSINQRLDAETISIVADEFGFKTEFVSADVVEAIGEDEIDNEEDLIPRPPIVTVMGHVDHGKTSLLDYIRNANVIAGEAGGITQHIGAYNVKLENGQRITFLDTPGHEAFTAMRARGAKVTDIAIIIVAADDSVMPQTREAINHAAAANVPMVFAINKVDKPGANPEKIKETLANMNYLVEDWGGKYQSHEISAKFGKGVEGLLEKVILESDLLELKANPNRRAIGSVIESSLDKGRGYVSTVLVQNGTLRQGDVVLAGTHFGKIKAMFNERNQRITEAKPSEPVLILGLNGAPQAGDNFNVMATEQEARDIANKREQLQREQSLRTKKHFTLDELGRRIALGDFKELNIIVKGDVDGSVEALSDSLLKLSTENIQVNVIHKAVGAISDSDILLAAASNAIICGFQVRPTSSARKLADKEEIDIRLYSIIYDAIEEIKSAMEGMLSPEIKEEITATVEIMEVFKITKVGTIAGCLVREGKIKRTNKVRIIRDGIVVHTGELDSLKRFKDDVKEVGTNYECGLNIKNFNDIKVGDMVESYEETEVKKTL